MKKTAYLIGALIAIGVIIFVTYYTFRYILPTRLEPEEYSSTKVDRGMVTKTLDADGIVEPENEVLLRSSFGGVIKRIINLPGSHVKAGEIILLMETEPVLNEIENAENQLEVLKNNLQKNKLTAKSSRVDLDYNVEMRKLKIASIKSDLSDQKELLEVGGISPARIAKTEQELVLAEKELETILQRNSIRLQQLEAEEKGMHLQIEMKERELEQKKEIISKMVIKAPSAGIILNIYGKEGEKLNSGDLLIQMSDLTSFKISGSTDEQYAEFVKTGGKVFALIDRTRLPGTIGRVQPVINNNKVNFDVYLDESSNPKLIPNLNIQIEIVTEQRDSVLRVKKGEAFNNLTQQKAFVINEDHAVRTEVTMGLIGNDYLEIISGVEEGSEIITSDISSLRHMKEVEIVK